MPGSEFANEGWQGRQISESTHDAKPHRMNQ